MAVQSRARRGPSESHPQRGAAIAQASVALLWHRLVRRRRAAARLGEATRSDGSAWSARLGDGSVSTARLSDGAARLWAAVARQGSALPRQGKARLRSQPHRLSEARPEPRFAPRRHSTDATCTATAWTGYAPQGRCSEPQSCGTALDSLAPQLQRFVRKCVAKA